MVMAAKRCFVSSCFNSSEQNTNKLFIMVPMREDIRMRWCVAVNRPFTKTKKLYCCEDHFNLKFDMMNWMEYKLIGSRIYMREDVIPHKFINSPKPTKHPLKSQLSLSSRKRRSYSLEKLGDKIKRKFDLPSESSPEVRLTNQIDSPLLKFSEIPVSYLSEESLVEECDSGLPTQPEQTLILKYSPLFKFSEIPVSYPSEESLVEECESGLPTRPEQTLIPTYSDKKIQVNIKPKYRSVCIGTSISVSSCATNTNHLKKKTVLRSHY